MPSPPALWASAASVCATPPGVIVPRSRAQRDRGARVRRCRAGRRGRGFHRKWGVYDASSGRRPRMHGHHARPTKPLFGPTSQAQEMATGHNSHRHSRHRRPMSRLRRRLLVYRSIEFLSSRVPGGTRPDEECLLLVHIRKVVGQVRYRICDHCEQGVITEVTLEERFRSTGLGTRALSHVRSRHPNVRWRSTLNLRATRDLLRRMSIPAAGAAGLCPHSGKLGLRLQDSSEAVPTGGGGPGDHRGRRSRAALFGE
ncbi:conserved protein of unknown function [Streptomyces sp. KY75]|nr:conserved protein of unknown function [Streptomyces sp. KY75]CAD5991368.1 conserved protein of unknown function [Streptomyces sp. KY70]